MDGLSREDMQAVAREARSLGMGMAHKGEDHLRAVLPKDFMQLDCQFTNHSTRLLLMLNL